MYAISASNIFFNERKFHKQIFRQYFDVISFLNISESISVVLKDQQKMKISFEVFLLFFL